MTRLAYALPGLAALALAACSQPANGPAPAPVQQAQVHNMLSAEEQAAGWRLLFNGSDLSGWRLYRGGAPQAPWTVEDGTLHLSARGGGDIMTEDQFGPFELTLDWKISPNGNSGIMYLVQEHAQAGAVWHTGPEYQVLDDDGHPDGQIPSHRAGAIYDFDAPLVEATNPVGEWNAARILFTGDRIEHWLNGQLVAESSYGDDAWRAAIAETKFANMPLFGTFSSGHIALQDHADPVWYRNIKIRPLT